MSGLMAIFMRIGTLAFGMAAVFLLFYTAALLLPFVLLMFTVLFAIGWYRQYKIRKQFENLRNFVENADEPVMEEGRASKIIDAEFEIVDANELKK